MKRIQLALAGAVLAASGFSAFSQTVDPPPPVSHTPRLPDQQPPMRVEVIDGTSFRDIETGQVYRLYGVETCAPNQIATYSRQKWPCGTVATAWLVSATLNKWLICTPIRTENGVNVARCASGEIPDLAAALLKTGWGVLPPDAGDRLIAAYQQAEADAKKAYRGLWGSAFMMPWEWRRQEAAIAAEPPPVRPPDLKSPDAK
jgi:endonuclease YncB( thermonuclease family)